MIKVTSVSPSFSQRIVQQGKAVTQPEIPLQASGLHSKDFDAFSKIRFGEDPYEKRFMDKVHGNAKKDFWERIKDGKIVIDPKKGISFPAPDVEQPIFTPRSPNQDGAGQGDGEEGDVIQQGQPKKGQGKPGQAGQDAGEHDREVWTPNMSPQEVMSWIEDILHLPNLKLRPGGGVPQTVDKYDRQKRKPPGIVQVMPTYKKALKRTMGEQGEDFDPNDGIEFQEGDIVRQDYRQVERPKAKTVLFLVRDRSASMGEEEKKRTRIHSFLFENLLRHLYAKEAAAETDRDDYTNDDFWNNENFKIVYITHDVEAEESSRDDFYNTTQGGGTEIASAYHLVNDLIDTQYPVSQWNVYVQHYSDGDTFGNQDDQESAGEVEKMLAKGVNRFSFVDVASGRTGKFTDALKKQFKDRPNTVAVTRIDRSDDPGQYGQSIKTILSEVAEEDK